MKVNVYKHMGGDIRFADVNDENLYYERNLDICTFLGTLDLAIEQPKRKVNKAITVVVYANLYADGKSEVFYHKKVADENAGNRIACEMISHTFVVEVEE